MIDISIFDKYHHDIIYHKINIFVPVQPIYIHEDWNYKKANVENFKKAISNFNWNNVFENLAFDEKYALLNQIFLQKWSKGK